MNDLYLKGDGSKYCVGCFITISSGVVEAASLPITILFQQDELCALI